MGCFFSGTEFLAFTLYSNHIRLKSTVFHTKNKKVGNQVKINKNLTVKNVSHQ